MKRNSVRCRKAATAWILCLFLSVTAGSANEAVMPEEESLAPEEQTLSELVVPADQEMTETVAMDAGMEETAQNSQQTEETGSVPAVQPAEETEAAEQADSDQNPSAEQEKVSETVDAQFQPENTENVPSDSNDETAETSVQNTVEESPATETETEAEPQTAADAAGEPNNLSAENQKDDSQHIVEETPLSSQPEEAKLPDAPNPQEETKGESSPESEEKNDPSEDDGLTDGQPLQKDTAQTDPPEKKDEKEGTSSSQPAEAEITAAQDETTKEMVETNQEEKADTADEPFILEAERDGIKLSFFAEPGVVSLEEEPEVSWEPDEEFVNLVEEILSEKIQQSEVEFKHFIFHISGSEIRGTIQGNAENLKLKDLEKKNGDAEISVFLMRKAPEPETLSVREEDDEDRVSFGIRETGVYDLVIQMVSEAEKKEESEDPGIDSQETSGAEAEKEPEPEEDLLQAEGTTQEETEQEPLQDVKEKPQGHSEPEEEKEEPQGSSEPGKEKKEQAVSDEENLHAEGAKKAEGPESNQERNTLPVPEGEQPRGSEETELLTEQPAMPPFEQTQTVNGVRVMVSAPEGAFPAGAVLEVTIPDDATLEQASAAMQEKMPDSRQIVSAYYFDIKILSSEGEELQPADGKTVTVSFGTEEVGDPNLRADVYHMTEGQNGGMDAQGLPVSESGETVEADTTGFSVYTLVLSYDVRQFDILPDTDTLVTTVLNAVGLEGMPTAVFLKDEGKPAQFFLTGDQAVNWTLKAAKDADAKPVLEVTIRETNYQVRLFVEHVQQSDGEIGYLDGDGNIQTWKDGYTSVSGGTLRAGDGYSGWWAVDHNVTVNQRINVIGDVCLILCDDCTLNAVGGIQVSPGNSLTVYAQGKGNGTLNASSREAAGVQTATGAAIGGAMQEGGLGDAGTIRIYGGIINATAGAKDCAGIGGGTAGAARVFIEGGTVNAVGNGYGAGIGGDNSGTKVSITGGDVTAKAGSTDGAGITGLYGTEIVFQSGVMVQGATAAPGQTDANGVTYAPDGSIYTGDTSSSAGKSVAGSFADYAVPSIPESRVYYEANSAPGMDSVTQGPGTEGMTIITGGPGSGDYIVATGGPGSAGGDDALEEGSVYNALLVVLDPEQASEMKPFIGKAIFFENHRAGGERETEEDVLQAGLEGVDGETLLSLWNAPGAPKTAEELIASFGFMEGLKEDEKLRGPGGTVHAEDPDRSVHAALDWVKENGTIMERMNAPFFMSVHLDNPASSTSAKEARNHGEETLGTLIDGLEEEGLLDRTVLFCTVKGMSPEETVPMMILHPDWPEGAVVEEKTSHMDVLPTILELNRVSGEARQSILQVLPGRDLLAMVAEQENEQKNTIE